MKKMTAFFLITVMSFSLLCGCEKDEVRPGKTDAAAKPIESTEQFAETERPQETEVESTIDSEFVGEWKIDWDLTEEGTGQNGQQLFGTSVTYGNALVLTADYHIDYFFSLYGGSGTYQYDGEKIIVNSTSYEPDICSDLKQLIPVYIDGKQYLCMDLLEILPYWEEEGPLLMYWTKK